MSQTRHSLLRSSSLINASLVSEFLNCHLLRRPEGVQLVFFDDFCPDRIDSIRGIVVAINIGVDPPWWNRSYSGCSRLCAPLLMKPFGVQWHTIFLTAGVQWSTNE